MISQIHQFLQSLKSEGADVVSVPEIISEVKMCFQEMANGNNQLKNAPVGQVGVGMKQQAPKANPMQM